MIVKGLDHVYYWSRDMDRAVAFYRDVLGLSVTRRDGDNWTEFAAGGAHFAIHGVVDSHPVQPGGATAGSAFGTQPVLKTEDAFGNLSAVGLGSTVTVTVALASGTGTREVFMRYVGGK